MTDSPCRGEVWLVALGAGRSGELGKTRPAVVLSTDELSTGAREELFVVVPVSSSLAPSAMRIDLPSEAGVERSSRAICRAVRAVVGSRFVRRIGSVDLTTMHRIESALVLILELDKATATD